MRFSPSEVRVKQGETVRFVAKNGGKVMHEMVLGTLAELKAHAELMKKYPGHGARRALHGARPARQDAGNRLARSRRPGEFHYGCLLPGHLEAGMIGRVIVAAK